MIDYKLEFEELRQPKRRMNIMSKKISVKIKKQLSIESKIYTNFRHIAIPLSVRVSHTKKDTTLIIVNILFVELVSVFKVKVKK